MSSAKGYVYEINSVDYLICLIKELLIIISVKRKIKDPTDLLDQSSHDIECGSGSTHLLVFDMGCRLN